jgi:hypothetical protein
MYKNGGDNCEMVIETRKEIELLKEQLREQTKSFCTHCGRLFPKGQNGLQQFREHIAECNAHPLHVMAIDVERLRAELQKVRSACLFQITAIERLLGEDDGR